MTVTSDTERAREVAKHFYDGGARGEIASADCRAPCTLRRHRLCRPRASLFGASIYGLNSVSKNIVGNRLAKNLTIVGCRAKMNARKDSSILNFFKRCRKAVKRSNDSRHHVRCNAKTRPLTKVVRQHGSGSTADAQSDPTDIRDARASQTTASTWDRQWSQDYRRSQLGE